MDDDFGPEEEPFELNLNALQGKWMHDPLKIYLIVRGKTVAFMSGETYTIETSPSGKLEVFGYIASPKKSDATSIVWKHKDTGEVVKWHFEGLDDDSEVDSSNIIHDKRRKRSRVDYSALDKELDHISSKRGAWQKEYQSLTSGRRRVLSDDELAPPNQPTRESPDTSNTKLIQSKIKELISMFDKWLKSSCTATNDSISSRKDGLKGELHITNIPREHYDETYTSITKKVLDHLTTLNIQSQATDHSIFFSVKDTVWRHLLQQKGFNLPQSISIENEKIPCDFKTSDTSLDDLATSLSDPLNSDTRNLEILTLLDRKSVTTDDLKRTKVGLTVNKLSTHGKTKLAQTAKTLLDKWKTAFRNQHKP